MTDIENAKEILRHAETHLSRVYPTDQLAKAVEDMQEAMPLPIQLPPPYPVVEPFQSFEDRCSRIIGEIQNAEIRLQSARTKLTALRNVLNTL